MSAAYDMNPDREVLNKPDISDREDLIVKTDENKRRIARSSRYESVEFTDESVDFSQPFEDEALISGQVKPTVSAVYDTGYDGKPNFYDPDKEYEEICYTGDSFDRTQDMGPLQSESYATPEFFKNPVDLIIGSAVAFLVIVLEIIAFFIVF